MHWSINVDAFYATSGSTLAKGCSSNGLDIFEMAQKGQIEKRCAHDRSLSKPWYYPLLFEKTSLNRRCQKVWAHVYFGQDGDSTILRQKNVLAYSLLTIMLCVFCSLDAVRRKTSSEKLVLRWIRLLNEISVKGAQSLLVHKSFIAHLSA